MRLRRFTDNALRSLIYLTLNNKGNVNISEIADNFKVSNNHLIKVIHFLAQNELVETSRGRGGGIRLMRPADQISVGHVVRISEGQQDIINCFQPLCPISSDCILRCAFHRAREAFLLALDEYTIADLIGNQASMTELLGIS